MITKEKLGIHLKNYMRTAKVLRVLEKLSKVNIKLHNLKDQIERGDVFIFNHFARFETFIPQYLFYKEAKVLCHSIATSELFDGSTLGNFLLNIGAVPNNYRFIIDYLAQEANRGIKIIIFPEGLMVKDKSVLDHKRRLGVYTRDKKKRKEPRTGAAVIALKAQTQRDLFRLAERRKDTERKDKYSMHLSSIRKISPHDMSVTPVGIVPSNITFYPIRVSENLLSSIGERFSKKSKRLAEELFIEGNILLKDTDMDIYMGEPIFVKDYCGIFDRFLLELIYRFDVKIGKDGRGQNKPIQQMIRKAYNNRIRTLAGRIRNDYMFRLYSLITVNLSHLASEMIHYLFKDKGIGRIKREFFSRALYLSIKELHKKPNIFLHRNLRNPLSYGLLLSNKDKSLEDFMEMAEKEGLIKRDNDEYEFLPKLLEECDFHQIRLENTIRVRYNEIRPVEAVERTVQKVIENYDSYSEEDMGSYLFDDDIRTFHLDLKRFSKPEYDDINKLEESKDKDREPFFLRPDSGRTLLRQDRAKAKGIGVLLIHGYAASPPEVRPLGEFLYKNGLTVYGVRLKGHGTSPYDLAQQTWQEWYSSVLLGYDILCKYCDIIFVAGFSMGGGLALNLAADKGESIRGVISISAPIIIKDKSIVLVPFVDNINKLLKRFPYIEGIKNFIKGNPENPHINYMYMPISSLSELRKFIEYLKSQLVNIYQPTLVIQGKGDSTVDPKSAVAIMESIFSKKKELYEVDSDGHVIIMENNTDIYNRIIQFIKNLCRKEDGVS